jgi:hypothetical protein
MNQTPSWIPPGTIHINDTAPLHIWLLQPDITAFLRAQANNPLLNYAISFAKRRSDIALIALHYPELLKACTLKDLPEATRCVIAQTLLDADAFNRPPNAPIINNDDERLSLQSYVYNRMIIFNYTEAMILLDKVLMNKFNGLSDNLATIALVNHGWHIEVSDILGLRSRMGKR